MKPVKKENIPGLPVKESNEPVYEGEIIYRDENSDLYQEKTAVAKKEEQPPARKLAYNLGKFTGSLISAVGVIGEFVRMFRSGKNSPGRSGSTGPARGRRCKAGQGLHRRQRKGKRCFDR